MVILCEVKPILPYDSEENKIFVSFYLITVYNGQLMMIRLHLKWACIAQNGEISKKIRKIDINLSQWVP